MSRLMGALAELIVHRARVVLVIAAVGVGVAGVTAAGVDELLSTGGNEVPGSDSVAAAALLDAHGGGTPNLLVLVRQEPALGPEAARLAADVEDALRAEGDVSVLANAWLDEDDPAASEPLRSNDGDAGLIVAHIAGDDAAVQARSAEISADLRSRTVPEGLSLQVGGTGPARADLIETTDDDLIRAELLALPLSLLVLLWVLRTPLAAALPLMTAVVAVLGALATLRLLAEAVEISVFARSVATAIGLAMAVDMTLFFVSRYREHRPWSASPATAVSAAIRSAGPAMLFSGLTTGASLAALLAFSIPMLRSFAYAGTAVVGFALVGGLVVLPAVLVVLGDRIERWPIRAAADRHGPEPSGRWHRLAVQVMARPLMVGLVTLTVLLVVASPIRRLDFGLNDERVLPPSVESRAVLDTVRQDFSGLEGGSISIVFRQEPPPAGDRAAFEEYRAELAALDGVARVDDRGRWLAVVPEVEPISAEGRQLVERIRSIPPPQAAFVGGEAARLVDNTDHVTGRLPLVLGLMIAASSLLLAVLFRSVLLTVKAIALNLLSLSAMFGAIVWVFQDGRFAGLLGYTPTGLTDITVPMLMFGIAFGLAMDYEVFLLSRIRDEYRRTGDTVASTAWGLQRTGGVLSASAVLMAIVFLSFATGSVTHLKVLGIGISLAVLVDAFIVRALLVPSFMAIGGSANWWPGERRRHRPEAATQPTNIPRRNNVAVE